MPKRLLLSTFLFLQGGDAAIAQTPASPHGPSPSRLPNLVQQSSNIVPAITSLLISIPGITMRWLPPIPVTWSASAPTSASC